LFVAGPEREREPAAILMPQPTGTTYEPPQSTGSLFDQEEDGCGD
jgi:hypothetical protein